MSDEETKLDVTNISIDDVSINLNSLFKLSYSFDSLKQVIALLA
jgi:hypothetical protein